MKHITFLWHPVVAVQAMKAWTLLPLEKLSLYPGFSYVHQILPFPSNYAGDISDQKIIDQ
jgi:hypothetical protein